MGKTIIYVLFGALATVTVPACVLAQDTEAAAPADSAPTPPPAEKPPAPALAKDPPARYVVVKGDTLWDISARFLRDPWRWPDIWGLNRDQIRNPHWIYPGDVIVLDFSGLTPRLRFEGDADWKLLTTRLSPKMRTQGLPPSAIPSIAAANLNAFLTKPLVVGEYELAAAPRIVAAQETRVVLGPGDIAFAKGLVSGGGSRYQAVRPGRKLVDPDTKEFLGREAIFLGEVNVQEFGEISTVKIAVANQEIAPGDRLVDAPPASTSPYMPHGPLIKVRGKIIAAGNDSVSEIGPLSVVVLNRGARDGLET
ncbi:MAG: LysM peptidoglycan-binding domain-containing protein, partial [Burkholderiales bacterium]